MIANIEAENVVLAAMLIDSKMIDRVADLVTPEDFADPLVARMFMATRDSYFAGKACSGVALNGMFKDDDQTARGDDIRSLVQAGEIIKELPIHVADASTLSIHRLNVMVRRYARRFAAKGERLDLVVVDYLQLLSADKGKSAYEAVSQISRALKAIAKEHDVAVMALAQLSREVEKRPGCRPQLSDLRDSGQIEQDADMVMFLLRNEYYLNREIPAPYTPEAIKWEEAMNEHRGKIEFICAKRRNGETGVGKGAFHGAYQAVRGL